MTAIELLNKVCDGWSQAFDGGLLCNPNVNGGIIDKAIVSGEWFIIFNDDRAPVEGIDSLNDAIEFFASSQAS